MIYKELLDLYDKLDSYKVVAPPAHTTITPKIGVLLNPNGNFMGAMYINETAIVPCTEQSEYRTSNIAPHLIHDNLSYVGNLPGYEARFSAYMKQLEDYIKHVDDPIAKAVYAHAGTGLLLHELKPITDSIPVPIKSISVSFGIPGLRTTINYDWTRYYVDSLPINGLCSITGEPAYIPYGYPKNLRKQGDMAKLFLNPKAEESVDDRPVCAPGYVASQKICHALQWLTSAPDVTAGNDDGPLYNYVTIREYAKIHGVNPANIRQKILRGTLKAERLGNEWLIDKDTPYTDARRR